MTVHHVDAPEPRLVGIDGVAPVAQLGHDEEVTPLLLLHVVGGPGTVAGGEADGPYAVEPVVEADVGCERCVVEQVVAHGPWLDFGVGDCVVADTILLAVSHKTYGQQQNSRY